MTFEEWLVRVPARMTRDPIWARTDYRLAAYVGQLAWTDVERLVAHPATAGVAEQLYRALGSINAQIAEGYSRTSGADRARFYEYALGSARESREWYAKAAPVLGEAVVAVRLHALDQIVRLLVTAIKNERLKRIPKRQA
jgi:four helix bundle protein